MLGALLTTTACGGKKIEVNGIVVYERYWLKTIDELEPQASHELHCSGDQLDYALLRRDGRHPVAVGVRGCGQDATYVRTVAHGVKGTWHLDSLRPSAEPAVAPAPQP